MTLKQIKDKRGFTIQEMADLCGVTPRTIHNWFNGVGEPKYSQWEKLLNY